MMLGFAPVVALAGTLEVRTLVWDAPDPDAERPPPTRTARVAVEPLDVVLCTEQEFVARRGDVGVHVVARGTHTVADRRTRGWVRGAGEVGVGTVLPAVDRFTVTVGGVERDVLRRHVFAAPNLGAAPAQGPPRCDARAWTTPTGDVLVHVQLSDGAGADAIFGWFGPTTDGWLGCNCDSGNPLMGLWQPFGGPVDETYWELSFP